VLRFQRGIYICLVVHTPLLLVSYSNHRLYHSYLVPSTFHGGRDSHSVSQRGESYLASEYSLSAYCLECRCSTLQSCNGYTSTVNDNTIRVQLLLTTERIATANESTAPAEEKKTGRAQGRPCIEHDQAISNTTSTKNPGIQCEKRREKGIKINQ